MMKSIRAATLIAVALTTFSSGSFADPVKTTIYRFKGGKDGALPLGPLVADKAGNLFGVTYQGGVNDKGTVFMLSPPVPPNTQWKKTVLHTFAGSPNDGRGPMVGLKLRGNRLYGATFYEGVGQHGSGGSVFRLTPPKNSGAWSYEILYSFTDDAKGYGPAWPLVFDAEGAIYGLLMGGGPSTYPGGVLYKLTPAKRVPWEQTILSAFTTRSDGSPHIFGGAAGLIFDASGALVTTSFSGGTDNAGTVFRVTPSAGGTTTAEVLHNFGGNFSEGIYLTAGVVADSTGALYGTTLGGGANDSGVIFMLTPPVAPATDWGFTKLYDFPTGGSAGPLIFSDRKTLLGSVSDGGRFGYGYVFRLQRPAAGQTGWQASVLYDFRGGANGATPGGLLFARDKVIYGVTSKGGTACDCGTIFKIEQ